MLFSIMHNDIIRILLKIPYDENELFVSLYEMYVCWWERVRTLQSILDTMIAGLQQSSILPNEVRVWEVESPGEEGFVTVKSKMSLER